MDCTHSIPTPTARFFRFIIDSTGSPPPSENHEGSKARHRSRLAVRHIELSADVCYFIGEEIPSRAFLRKNLPLPLPDGYSHGSINLDGKMNRR